MRFEAVPPGAEPTRTTPTKISGGKLRKFPIKYAEMGITVYWRNAP